VIHEGTSSSGDLFIRSRSFFTTLFSLLERVPPFLKLSSQVLVKEFRDGVLIFAV
jgi:hypothetical protein